MKRIPLLVPAKLALTSLLALVIAGCASQQNYQPSTTGATATAPVATPAPAPAPAAPTAGYGPSYTLFEKDGVQYQKGSMAFPTGMLSSSGLLLEKVVPKEVMVGEPFIYQYKVINLTGYELSNVQVTDRVTENFRSSSANPEPESVSGGVATWNLGGIEPNGEKYIQVNGSANEEGLITTCGWASYVPILCESIQVVKADLQLVKRMPAEVVICDPIPITLTVKNTGSSVLNNVVVTDNLPAGLVAQSGGQVLSFDAGTLAPGESREFTASAMATRKGEFKNSASAKSQKGISAEDSATVMVLQPMLQITCTAPDERFIGRPINVCLTVANEGDAPTKATVVTLPMPQSATFQGATAGGTLSGNNVVWNLGAIPAGSNKEVCVTFTGNEPANLRFTGQATDSCATAVESVCQTKISGIPAILLEVIDLADPIEVGSNETYEIVVTNQGSAPATNTKIVCELEDTQEYVSASGATSASVSGNVITMEPVPSIPAKGKATWRVVVKALKPGDIRFDVKMTSDFIVRPVEETESTHQY